MADASKVANVLGGKAVLGRDVRSLGELDAVVSKGLPKRALLAAAKRAAMRPEESRALIHRLVPRATFARVKVLGPLHSERTERLARLVALAEEVWGDAADAREWLNTPHPELDGKSPTEAAVTELGAQRAEYVLRALAHGLPV